MDSVSEVFPDVSDDVVSFAMPPFDSTLSEGCSCESSSVSITDVSLLSLDVESSSELEVSTGVSFFDDSSSVSAGSWAEVSS